MVQRDERAVEESTATAIPMATPAEHWIADRGHDSCGEIRIVHLQPLRPEKGLRRRRGRRRNKLPRLLQTFHVGLCFRCGKPRILAYPPRTQLALQFSLP